MSERVTLQEADWPRAMLKARIGGVVSLIDDLLGRSVKKPSGLPLREALLSKYILFGCFFWVKGFRLRRVDLKKTFNYPAKPFLSDHPAFQNGSWPINRVELPKTFVVEVPLGRTVGARGNVIAPDNGILTDVTMCERYDQRHYLLDSSDIKPRKARFLKGRYALLNCYGTSTYHWMYDCLPRAELLRRAGYDLDSFDGILMRRPKYVAHLDTIRRAGIPEEKIVWCTKNSHYQCERLVVPSFTSNERTTTERDHHPWVYPFLKGLVDIAEARSGKKRRLLINRKDSQSTSRQIVNRTELAERLKGLGFEEVTLGELDFESQARLFASAEFIVAAHGGGLSNLCFCEPSTKVVELFAPDFVPTHFRNITRSLGMEYQPLVMESVKNPNDPVFGGDIQVDVAKLEQLIQTMLI